MFLSNAFEKEFLFLTQILPVEGSKGISYSFDLSIFQERERLCVRWNFHGALSSHTSPAVGMQTYTKSRELAIERRAQKERNDKCSIFWKGETIG